MGISKKHFNEKHEVIFHTEMVPVNKSDQDGIVNEHKQVIRLIKYYQGFGTTKSEISISRDFILDLAEEIKNIELVRENLEQQENLPF